MGNSGFVVYFSHECSNANFCKMLFCLRTLVNSYHSTYLFYIFVPSHFYLFLSCDGKVTRIGRECMSKFSILYNITLTIELCGYHVFMQELEML